MDESSFDMCRRLFPEPPREVSGGVFISGKDTWDNLSSNEDEPPCDEEKRRLCDEFGPDAVLCSGCERDGDGYKDEDGDCFGDILTASNPDPVGEVGEKFNEEMWKGFGIAMERILGMPPEKVIFNGPATIAIWPSGDKIVAKCSGNDSYDREKGLMMCLLKKAYGSKAVDIIEEWIGE